MKRIDLPVAFISGINGQDGSYLAELLLSKGYQVKGLIRRTSTPELGNLSKVLDNPQFQLVHGDLTDYHSISTLIRDLRPLEIYNLGAMSFVGESWNQVRLTNEVNYLGFLNVLEAVRAVAREADEMPRIYQASSSEMYGNQPAPQNEDTPMIPRSPYGVSKLAAHALARVYRESFGMFICAGVLFNHESPRRGSEFVTRKMVQGIAGIKRGELSHVHLGTLSAKRDWGHAKDYVRAMWLMLQQPEPLDYVVATGETWSVRDFFLEAMKAADLPGVPEDYVIHERSLDRPAEINVLCGDATLARNILGWKPEYSFRELVGEMIESELFGSGL